MTGKRGPYAGSADRRRSILIATLELVQRLGHPAVTMKLVADQVGVTDAALYYHFPTRDHLLVEALRYRDEVAPERDDPDRNFLTEAMRHNTEVRNIIALYADFNARAVDPDHPAHDYFDGRYKGITATLAERLDDDYDTLPGTPKEIAAILTTLADGLQTRWLVEPTFDMARHITIAIDALLPATVQPNEKVDADPLRADAGMSAGSP